MKNMSGMNSVSKGKEPAKHACIDDCFYGAVTVGERGQIVVPADAREELGIRPGDKLLIMRHPVFKGLMVAKFESIRDYHDEFMQQLERMHEKDVDKEG